MSAGGGIDNAEITEPVFDLTPMIDVVLLLIIFFTLTAQFSNVMLTPMNLPAEKGGAPDPGTPAQVVIEMRRDGTYVLSGQEVGLDKLAQGVSADIRQAGDADHVDVVVRADRDALAAGLNDLAATLTQIGVRNWRLATAGGGG